MAINENSLKNLKPFDSQRAKQAALRRREIAQKAVIAGMKRACKTESLAEAVAKLAEKNAERILDREDKSHVIMKALFQMAGLLPEARSEIMISTQIDDLPGITAEDALRLLRIIDEQYRLTSGKDVVEGQIISQNHAEVQNERSTGE
ncbi:MAG: hypothetical protein D6735_13710 [Acidobacteria bacterium]|nr:MAG: hypothetical protein D6735_13710 [Acidobacteriota bacterium]